MVTQSEKADQFLTLHRQGSPLLLPNPWDAGSAKVLASLGFAALATTSGGFAATLGRADHGVTRDEALAHCEDVVGATDLPVSADLERCFATEPAGVAETVSLAIDTGLAGCSVEDFSGSADRPIFDVDLAAERVAAAAEVAHGGPVHFVLTARTENYLYGHRELADTIARLQRYQEAGADVLFAPGITALDEIRELVSSVERPVNVLAVDGAPTVAELAEAGVARVSVGGAFAFAAMGALVDSAREFQSQGTYGYRLLARTGSAAAREAFQP